MKKILFNNRYGLETAVIERRKTMTRRIVRCPKTFRGVSDVELEFRKRPGADFYFDCVVTDGDGRELGQLPLPYELGEVVAVGQRYSDVPMDFLLSHIDDPRKRYFEQQLIQQSAGWRNKMFTLPEKMPWQVQMTDLWFEHLQDISDEDCLREGVERWLDGYIVSGLMERSGRNNRVFDTPREAFAALIDRINGRGTWQDNPWAVAYTMELQSTEGFKEQKTKQVTTKQHRIMTYQTLNDVIKRLAEKSRVPAEQMQQFEVATGMRGQRETVMLCGLMPQTQYGARPLIVAGCELMDNIILADTERVDCYDVRNCNGWQDAFYDFGISLGLAHDYLTKKLLIVFGGQGRMQEI